MPSTQNGHTTTTTTKIAAVEITALLKVGYGKRSKEGIVCK